MKIVIVEDESLVAKRIERLLLECLSTENIVITHKRTFAEAKEYIFLHPLDLLILDLNLNGIDGFNLLKLAVTGSFHTIIISAYSDKALEAFEYGVVDFIGKPFTIERLKKGLDRLTDITSRNQYPSKFLAFRNASQLKLESIDDIMFIKGANIYSEVYLSSEKKELHDKNLEKLEMILPSNFVRIHKSFIVNITYVKNFITVNSSKFECILKNGEAIPVSRFKFRELKELLQV